jgi:hypothetical protein
MDASPGTVYLGGSFTTVGASNRLDIAAVDAISGLATIWDAGLVSPGAGRLQLVVSLNAYSNNLYFGGSLINVQGKPRLGAAAVDLTSGIATDWDPRINGQAYTFCGSGPSIFLGGNFGAVGCVGRTNLAAFDLASAQVTSWNPILIGRGTSVPVQAMTIASNQVFVGGFFTNIAGITRTNLASVDQLTGAVSSWAPNPNATIDALATWQDRLFVGGTAFSMIAGQARTNFAEFNLATLSLTSWDPQIRSFVQCLLVDANTLYVGGSFSSVSGQTRRKVASFDLTTDTLTTWDPGITNGSYVDALAKYGSQVYLGGLFNVVGGQNRTNFAAVDALSAAVLPIVANADSFVYGLAASSNQVYIAGNFSTIDGQPRICLASVDSSSGLVTSWNPGATSTYALAAVIWDNVLYTCGGFFRVGGETTASLAAFPLGLVGTPSIISNSMQRLPDGSVRFRPYALGAPQVTVQASSNILSWLPLQVVPLTAGYGTFTDSDATNHPARYYRLSVP